MVAGIPWDEIHPDAWPAPRPPKQGRRRRFLGGRRTPEVEPAPTWQPCADCLAPGLCETSTEDLCP